MHHRLMAIQYRTTMHSIGRNTGIPVPPEVLEQLGAGKRPAVEVSVNGYRYSGTVGSMGGLALISFSAERRAQSGIAAGDRLQVELAVDTAPRTVAPPADLATALAAAGATAAFGALAPSHQKAHVTAVESAKTPETRMRRVHAVVTALTA